MRTGVIELLKKIESTLNSFGQETRETLMKKGIDSADIHLSEDLGLITNAGAGSFTITEKGHSELTKQKTLESLEKINQSQEKPKQRIIFDSNIFDKLIIGELSNNEIEDSKINGFEYFITHVQTDEISKCSDEEKRKKLTLFFVVLKPTVVGTESFVIGTSRLGFAKLSDGQTFEKLRKGNLKYTNDALIGEVALKNDLVLVSEDKQLRNKVNSESGKAISFKEFKEMIK